MNEKLETVNAHKLMNTAMPPINFVIKDLMPQGLHILAGAPKIGKSWLSLWICLQVSKGEKIWNFETVQSTVLYLCLEDSFKRIQSRLFDITEEAPNTLHFATMCGSIGEGLELQIENFIKENQNTKLIVIDTLQKVRGRKGKSSNMYEDDYDDISAIKKLADKNNIAIILVHHLRKAKDEDPINMISGSSGISGSADTNFVLQKDSRVQNTAKLVCVGRDIESMELYIELNKDTHIWEQLKPIEVKRRSVDNSIINLCEFIKTEKEFTGTATELVEKLKANKNIEYQPATLKKNIIKHMDFINENFISYSENRTFERREFTLKYNIQE